MGKEKITLKLNNGTAIPQIGLGTWQMSPDEAYDSVKFALENGYVHIDGAKAYANSEASGRAWKDSGVKREDIWITTKIRAEIKDYESANQEIENELASFQTDYLDLVLIHCPQPWAEYQANGEGNRYFKENLEVWRAMVEAYEAGKIKALGVSNFHPVDLENIINNSDVKPVVNQISYRIGYTQDNYVEAAEANDVLIEAYSPLGTGKILNNDEIKKVADKYSRSVAQVAIQYCLQKGHIVLPKSVTPKYILENIELDFELSDEDMDYLDGLDTK